MRRIGEVLLKSHNRTLYVVWYKEGIEYERIDIFHKGMTYNVIDTSNLLASYIYSKKEMMFGDESLIKEIKRAISDVIYSKASSVQDSTFTDKGIVTTITKNDVNVGISSKSTLLNGLLTEEEYETPTVRITFNTISLSKDSNSLPINIASYTVVESKHAISKQDDAGDYHSLEYLKNNFPISHMDDEDYVVVQDYDTAVARLKMFRESSSKIKAVDTETTGVDIDMFGKDCITGVVLSATENDSTYFPFRQEKFPYNLPIEFMQEIVDAINEQPPDVIISAYNGKFEKEAFRKECPYYIKYSEFATNWKDYKEGQGLKRFVIRIDMDGYLLSTLIDPVMRKGLHGLKDRAEEAIGRFFLELSDIFKGEIKFNVLPPEIVRYYACPDTANTIRVLKYLLEKLPKDEWGIFQLENRLLESICKHEFYGLRSKRERLLELIETEEYKVKLLSELFKGIHNITGNINSPETKANIFYNKMRCPVLVRTKTGKPSTSVTALKQILKSGKLKDPSTDNIPPNIVDNKGNIIIKGEDLVSNKYPSLIILDKYNKATKELGALRRLERKSHQDRVIFNINQTGAGSGRQTSDAHQYSDSMKSLVIADSRWHRLWSADFKQIELRILAYLSGQEDLIALECDPRVDIHRAIASIITGKEMWNISAEERSNFKHVNFGVVYLMSKYGLASSMVGPAYTEKDLIAAEKSITDFYNGLPKIKAFIAGNKRFVRENGYIKTKMGRYRFFRNILDPTVSERDKAKWERAANNTPVQGFGADYLKIVICNVDDYIREKGWDELVDCDGIMLPKVRVMLSIHDELLVSTHRSIPIEEIMTMFKVCMELEIKGAPPFFSAPAFVPNWYLGKQDAYEIPLLLRDKVVDEWAESHKIIVHAESYDEYLTMEGVEKMLELSKSLQSKFVTDDDYIKGEFKPKEDTLRRCLFSLDEDTKQAIIRHTIPSREVYNNEADKTIMAIRRILDSEFNPYLEDLNNYRTEVLRDYMSGLIAKYKTVDEVAEHVRDDELTHVLISKFSKKLKGLPHLEAIHKATELYMELPEVDLESIISTATQEDDVVETEIINSYASLEKYVVVNDRGELITDELDDVDETEEDEDITVIDFEAEKVKRVEREWCVYGFKDVLIDLSEFDLSVAEEINQKIASLSNKNGYYGVKYLVKGSSKLLKSNLKVDYIAEAINNLIREYTNTDVDVLSK